MEQREKLYYSINIDDYIEFKYCDFIFDKNFLIKYTALYSDNIPFDAKKINYNKICKVNSNNLEYLRRYIVFFYKPKKNELIKFLELENDFEMIIKINNGYNYSNLRTKKEEKKLFSSSL